MEADEEEELVASPFLSVDRSAKPRFEKSSRSISSLYGQPKLYALVHTARQVRLAEVAACAIVVLVGFEAGQVFTHRACAFTYPSQLRSDVPS